MQKKRWVAVLAALALLLGGCGEPSQSVPAPPVQNTANAQSTGQESGGSDKQGAFRSPTFRDAVFHEDAAEGDEGVRLDLSALQDGYVAVSANSDMRLKFQVLCGDDTYTYNLASDGTPSVFPLNCGDGEYRFRVMENVTDNKYAERYTAECEVALSDAFQPFLRPSDYVPYNEDSACVKKAAELASHVDNEIELVAAVYAFICDTVRYDAEKAAAVSSGYLPDPDETMYRAALAAVRRGSRVESAG